MEDSNSSSTSSEDSDDYEALPKVKRKPSKSHIHNLPKDENKYYYYGPDNCLRKRYRFCGDCSYKTPKMERLLSHIKHSHPASKTALPPPEIKPPKPAKIRIKKRGLKPPPDRLRAGTVLHCSKCEYRTIRSDHMRLHEERHERKTGHLCPLCSYSLKHKLDIYLHLKNHHSGSERDRILSERKDFDNQMESNQDDLEEKDDSEEWLYFARGSRTKYIHCGDCAFKSNRQNVETHVKRMHPNSTTAMPPPPPPKPEKVLLKCHHCDYSTMRKKEFERHEMHHRKKFAHQCSFCSFSLDSWNHIVRHAKRYHSNNVKIQQKKEKETSLLKEKEEWYYRQDGKRIRYQFCSDCDYKTTKPIHLEKHVKTMHPLSKTALPPPPSRKEQTLHRCTLCQYETPSQQNFDDHSLHHRKKLAHKCHLCSYTAKARAYIDRHLKNHHHRRKESGSNNFALFQCSECEYSTGHITNMKMHEKGHDRDEEFKCSRCNFSAEHEYLVTQHLSRYHQSAIASEHSKQDIVIVKRTLLEVNVENTSLDGKKVAKNIIASQKDPNKKCLLKCSLCLYTTDHTGNMMTHEEAHNRSQKYKCNRCSFSSNFKGIVKVHTKRYHLKASVQSPRSEDDSGNTSDKSREDIITSDGEVETHQYSSITNSDYTQADEYRHERKGDFKCSLCSFSSHFQATVDNHLQDCHTLKERKQKEAISTTKRTSTNSSSRKSQVTSDCFFGRASTSSSIKVEIEEVEAPQCNVQLLRFNDEQEAKLLDLQSRIQVMQKKVITAQKELEEASSKKKDVWDKMNEIAAKKVMVEYDLRAQQCEALELNIMSLDDEAGHNDVVLAEYSAMCLEDEIEMFEDEFQSLREQDANLIEDVEEAEGSFIGYNQVLLALMSELDSLVHG